MKLPGFLVMTLNGEKDGERIRSYSFSGCIRKERQRPRSPASLDFVTCEKERKKRKEKAE